MHQASLGTIAGAEDCTLHSATGSRLSRVLLLVMGDSGLNWSTSVGSWSSGASLCRRR